ncbi:MAG: hypothetical protein DRR19_00980 [Candidatus Parabeggiatoa sp. nov. 1]|nr:MAG: hypothetical protein DRR19_00980 [Gammaproteobacteria bacterium]
MSHKTQPTLPLQPIISYPRQAQVGETYLMTIDLEPTAEKWPYEEEEYPIYCMINTNRLFTSQPADEPVIVLHRFGGTYGQAKFLLTAKQEVTEGSIKVTLATESKWPIKVFDLTGIRVTKEEVAGEVQLVKTTQSGVPTKTGENLGLGDFETPVIEDTYKPSFNEQIYYLSIDFTEKVILGDIVSLVVNFTPEEKKNAEKISIQVPSDAEKGEVPVDIVIEPKSGFILDSDGEGSVKISKVGKPPSLGFRLKAVEKGHRQLQVHIYCLGELLRSMTVNRNIVENIVQATDEFIIRSLVADFSEQVTLNDTVSLLVSLSAEDVQNHNLPVLSKGSKVDIVIQTRRHFMVEGKNEGQLVISDEDETLPLQFKLKATALGLGKIRVLAFHEGQLLGEIKLSPTIVEQTTESPRTELGQRLEQVNIEQPDLLLLILEREHHGGPAVTFLLHAKDPSLELNFNTYGPISLRVEPLRFFQNLFKDIENLALGAIAEDYLATMGTRLFETIFPKELQELLWKLKDRALSLQIQSDEPWIPWELCKLQGRDEKGLIVESGFFCDAFVVTRWIPGIPSCSHLTLNNMALVVPNDSGLPDAKKERDYLLDLSNEKRKVTSISADFSSVTKALASGQYDAWHFTGHGLYRVPDPSHSGIKLEQQEQLRARDISGKVKNLGAIHHPLIFLNACLAGRSGLSLTNIGGFAYQSLQAGAGAFIGAYWSLFDQAAYQFATAFYDRLLAGQPIGKAVREARLEIKQLGDPTWLAYTVYAEPLAVVEEDELPDIK